jgi:hypothetical protein
MDVLRLDPGTYIPNELVEGYSSLIWTERYQTAGEFQMKIPNITYARELIPEGSYITLLDSREVMIVETHTIDKNDDGIPELTIVGRSFETFLENRDLSTSAVNNVDSDGDGTVDAQYFPQQLTTAEMAAYFLWNDVVSNPSGTPTPDWIPNLVVSDSTVSQDLRITREAEVWGEKYAKVLELLQTGGFGLRNIRPVSTNASLISFNTSYLPVRTSTPSVSQLRLDLYSGLDRSRYQSVNNSMVLRYDADDLTKPQYLFTLKDFKNVALVKTGDGNRTFYSAGASAATSGTDRRVLLVDASDIPYTAGTTDQASFESTVQTRALAELAKHNQKILFAGEMSPTAAYKYNVDYSLGDLVTLMGDYDFEQTMRVSEFVRTEDKDGDRGYPTLELAP